MRHLKHTTLIILSLALIEFSFAQNFAYPSIRKQGKELKSFIPKGWILLDSTKGDLNKDKFDDLVLVIQHKDSVKMIKHDFEESEPVITQPRMLLILFYNQLARQYELIEQNNQFILNHDNENMEDPYLDMSIHKGVLNIGIYIFMNMGGWEVSNNTYQFRYQHNEFALIGADCRSTNRASGATEDRSYNFLTKKVKISTGNISSDRQRVVWRKLMIKELKTIKNFKSPFSWQVEEDFYL